MKNYNYYSGLEPEVERMQWSPPWIRELSIFFTIIHPFHVLDVSKTNKTLAFFLTFKLIVDVSQVFVFSLTPFDVFVDLIMH